MEDIKQVSIDINSSSNHILKKDTPNETRRGSTKMITTPAVQIKREPLKETLEQCPGELGIPESLDIHVGNRESIDVETTPPICIVDSSEGATKSTLDSHHINEPIDLTQKHELVEKVKDENCFNDAPTQIAKDKEENLDKPNCIEKDGVKRSKVVILSVTEAIDSETTPPICIVESFEGAVALDFQNINKPKLVEKVKNENTFNYTPTQIAKDKEEHLAKPNHIEEVGTKRSDLPNSSELENLDELLKCEVDLNENNAELKSAELLVKSENSNKGPKLTITLERLSMANEDHKEAITKLPRVAIELELLDSRIMKKIRKFGFVKVTSELLKPLLQRQKPKKAYPKGHYFSRLRNVVYKDNDFDRHFFHKALRRKANVDDKGKFLKYQCPSCPYKSWSFLGVSKHHSGLHGSKINYTFSCPDCDFTTRHECTLKRHRQRHKKEPDLPCPHCPYITRFDVALRVHLRRWHLSEEEANTLKCPDCNFVSVCKTTYEAHLMVHMKRGENYLGRFLHNSASNEGDVLKCEYCKFRTPNKNGLRRHMQETHKIDNPFKKEKYRCRHCGFETKHRFSYRNHLLTHKTVDEGALFRCYCCDYKTKWKKYLVVHMRTDHPKVKKEKEAVVYYKCAECEKQYPKKYWLKNHIFSKHREAELLMCHHCNYTTKNMAVLKRHTLKIHINPVEKIYQCQKCSHVSKDRARHKAHLGTHKFICYICGLEATTKGAIRYHIVGHMTKKRQKQVVEMHRCQCCDYESRNKHHYERHMKRWKHFPEKRLEPGVKDVLQDPASKVSDVKLTSENIVETGEKVIVT